MTLAPRRSLARLVITQNSKSGCRLNRRHPLLNFDSLGTHWPRRLPVERDLTASHPSRWSPAVKLPATRFLADGSAEFDRSLNATSAEEPRQTDPSNKGDTTHFTEENTHSVATW